jgi:hypothetical protein
MTPGAARRTSALPQSVRRADLDNFRLSAVRVRATRPMAQPCNRIAIAVAHEAESQSVIGSSASRGILRSSAVSPAGNGA